MTQRRGRRPKPVLSSRQEAHERLASLQELINELRTYHWLLRVAAGATREPLPQPLLSPDPDDVKDRVAWALHVDGASGAIPGWLLRVVDDYRSARGAELQTRSLLLLAWKVVRGQFPPALAVKLAKTHGATGARETVVSAALEKRASDDDMRVKNVYFALARGSSAKYVEEAYQGMRQPLFRAIRETRRLSDILGGANVTDGPASSGSLCPTSDEKSGVKKASTRRKSSVKP